MILYWSWMTIKYSYSYSYSYDMTMSEIEIFLHDRPWLSPWIKSISNKLDVTFHVLASQLSSHCDVIDRRLRRDQRNLNRASATRRRCVKLVVFNVIDGFVMACKLFMHSLEWHFDVYFPRCWATREINTKITISWAHKQFATRVHTLFYLIILGGKILAVI